MQFSTTGLSETWRPDFGERFHLAHRTAEATVRLEHFWNDRWSVQVDVGAGLDAIGYVEDGAGIGSVIVPLQAAAHAHWDGRWLGLGAGLRGGLPFASSPSRRATGVVPVWQARIGPRWLHGWFGWRDGALTGSALHVGLAGGAVRWAFRDRLWHGELLIAAENFSASEFAGIAQLRLTGPRLSWVVGAFGGLFSSYGATVGIGLPISSQGAP